MQNLSVSQVQPIRWQDNRLFLLDQRLLPAQEVELDFSDAPGVAGAIRDMVVRGAPAIGITAAYGVVLSAIQHATRQPGAWLEAVQKDIGILLESRPTAINLHWALARMSRLVQAVDRKNPVPELLREAITIHDEDRAANLRMAVYGAALLPSKATVLTHCNTGALATGGYGTALGVIRRAHAEGRLEHVYASETRPWLQGARLTAWELAKERIPVSLLVEGAAASLMQSGRIDWVIVGADRIVANGDVANKIGTYSLAVAARHHGVKFMVVAPTSTFDMNLARGGDIPIEHRPVEEITRIIQQNYQHVTGWNPVFDVTPAELIDAIVTERGVVEYPAEGGVRQLLSGSSSAAL
ncbi:MAG TPA: S-methyl-5-thioribose-1-phosphate isomerase [Gammaproteobacteria bacterium]|nr:S-methyl-5-thioribose-1-phosphate isomerase [Gammaproteobacteria bacterium]